MRGMDGRRWSACLHSHRTACQYLHPSLLSSITPPPALTGRQPAMLRRLHAGRLPTIARNVLTAVFLFDPATPAALEIGSMAHQLEQQASCGS